MEHRKRVCFKFAAGHCSFGERCKFLHPGDNNDLSEQPRRTQQTQPSRPLTDTETQYRSWVKTIPRKEKIFHHSYANFFAEAYRLLQIDSAIMQDVVVKLSSEEGLQIIKGAIDQPRLDMLLATESEQALTQQVLPFLKILADPSVTSSLILEREVARLYNFLFGINGIRALLVFDFASTVLYKVETITEKVIEALETTVVVFRTLFEHNTVASLQDGFAPAAHRLEAVFIRAIQIHERSTFSNSLPNLARLFRQLELASELPLNLSKDHSREAPAAIKAAPRIDPPGGTNARHDNDDEDICNIKLLPTLNEIRSARPEYLPTNDHSTWHVGGVEGLIDRNFRLLREDTVGQLRDAIQHVMSVQTECQREDFKASRDVIRTNVYTNVRLDRCALGRPSGFNIRVSFHLPFAAKQLSMKERGDWWERSRRLQGDALVCLILTNGSPVFCTVWESPSTRASRSRMGVVQQRGEPAEHTKTTAMATLGLIEQDNVDQIRELLQLLKGPVAGDFALVEFPGILLPAFGPTLKALQRMKRAGDLPFADFLAPSTIAGVVVLPSPSYAAVGSFYFDLSPVVQGDEPLRLRLGQQFDIEQLLRRSSLDQAQAKSLIESLSHCIGLIQGPPGTGKSYTGLAALKVLLATKKRQKEAKIGPLLCICYTNHALDQLLEDILESNATKKIIRIGSQSKSEKLGPFKLVEVAKAEGKTRFEKRALWETHSELAKLEEDFGAASKNLRGTTQARDLHRYLQCKRPRLYRELFGADEDGFEVVAHGKPEAVFAAWLKSGTLGSGEQLSRQASLAGLVKSQRYAKYHHWLKEMHEDLERELLEMTRDFQKAISRQDIAYSESHLRCLRDADVIGVTTSGLARKIDVLRRVKCKVMLCEEAGEVLEPHLLAAMLPSLEHAILIGDHQQLRPQVQNFFDLSRDSPRGGYHSLDISLFERLVQPTVEGAIQLPFSKLEVQRRMHPSISALIRNTLYPDLTDHESVKNYPQVQGMKKRLFWLDHGEYESRATDEATATSHWNEFEVNMTLAIVTHLINQGTYRDGEIAVLTPYLGQLHRLRRRLQTSFVVTVDERDENELTQAGLLADQMEARPAAARSTLLNALRVATIDNFQGEEAKVIVISLVRSNPEHRCGFLRTSNRINVLLSRAKHGMYIVGNAATAAGVKMWSDVINMLRQNDNVGTQLELHCTRHADANLLVSKPEDFSIVSPEGGCKEPCGRRLDCGHACKKPCHSALMHSIVHCLEPCQRQQQGCEHPCPKYCGDICPAHCTVRIQDSEKKLQCGHTVTDLPCWQAQNLKLVDCSELVPKTVPGCMHTVTVRCSVDVTAQQYQCLAICSVILPCGHKCLRPCKCCRTGSERDTVDHGTCTQSCSRQYATCTHQCKARCHGDEFCPPCSAPCNVRCAHSTCVKICNEPCTPCAEEVCHSACPHSACSMPCAAPCNHVPCSLRCPKKLDCGHQCPSTCGDICPSERFCQLCATDEIRHRTVDVIEGTTYGEIDLDRMPCIFPICGHILTIESMDGQMGLNQHYETIEKDKLEVPISLKISSQPFSIDDVKLCFMCRGSLRDINRYGRLVRRAILDQSTKKMILWSNSQYTKLWSTLEKFLTEIQTFEKSKPTKQPPVVKLSDDKREKHMLNLGFVLSAYDAEAWRRVKRFRQSAIEFRRTAHRSEQPFSKVRDSVEAVRRRTGRDISFQFDGEILQNKGYILATSILIRLDLALLIAFLSLKRPISTTADDLCINWKAWSDELVAFQVLAENSRRATQQVEAHVYLAQLYAIQRTRRPEDAEAEDLRKAGVEHIIRGRELCAANPSQTLGMGNELNEVEKMLRETTFYTAVTTAERRAVIQAMATELRGTGHWYYCENGHPFTIGECGMAMEQATCSECSAAVGGQSHQIVAGNRRADDLERHLAV